MRHFLSLLSAVLLAAAYLQFFRWQQPAGESATVTNPPAVSQPVENAPAAPGLAPRPITVAFTPGR